MNVAVVYTRALAGLEAPLVRVEAHLGNGLPAFNIVGLPEAEVREARDRVRAALNTCGFEFPQRRITINLAPADLPKESGRFDLPIAIGILAAHGQMAPGPLARHELAGELALSGELRAVRGSLAMTLRAHRDQRAFVLPACVAAEAALAPGATVFPARDLLQVYGHLRGTQPLTAHPRRTAESAPDALDLRDVVGQQQARRALEVAAAGGHSILFSGPPGTGKTMLAQRLPGILPPMTEEEALEAAAVQSVSGRGFRPECFGVRAFRSPHHTASGVALVGGGSPPRPGEVSLAHHGVLFLDELPEFSRHVLDVLREPLESGRITISRAAWQSDFPAAFQLVAAMNPCMCGYLGHYSGRCRCTPAQVTNYRSRISGPLLDRIDMHVQVPALEQKELFAGAPGECSAAVRKRVVRARHVQLRRQGVANARLQGRQSARPLAIDAEGRRVLAEAAARMQLSARAHHRILKVARTIADLAGRERIGTGDLYEALCYRSL